MAMRSFAFVIIGLAGIALGGCMQETLEPSTQAGWNARDKQLMSNLPYQQAAIPDQFKRHIVDYSRKEVPSAKKPRPGAASPRLAAWKNGRLGFRPPASKPALDRCRPS
jgi:hypothetical protein